MVLDEGISYIIAAVRITNLTLLFGFFFRIVLARAVNLSAHFNCGHQVRDAVLCASAYVMPLESVECCDV